MIESPALGAFKLASEARDENVPAKRVDFATYLDIIPAPHKKLIRFRASLNKNIAFFTIKNCQKMKIYLKMIFLFRCLLSLLVGPIVFFLVDFMSITARTM